MVRRSALLSAATLAALRARGHWTPPGDADAAAEGAGGAERQTYEGPVETLDLPLKLPASALLSSFMNWTAAAAQSEPGSPPPSSSAFLPDSDSQLPTLRVLTMVVAGPPAAQTVAYNKFTAKVAEAVEERRVVAERLHSQAELEAARAAAAGGIGNIAAGLGALVRVCYLTPCSTRTYIHGWMVVCC